MTDNKFAKAIFLIPILALSYILSGFIVLLINKVPLMKAMNVWHFNFIYEAITRGYPYAWLSLLIAIVLSILFLVIAFVFVKQGESLHGDARFAKTREIRKAGLFGDKNNKVKRGIIIGKYGDKFLKFGGAQFVALGAPTRSGKGVGIVIPNLLEWQESAVVQDIK